MRLHRKYRNNCDPLFLASTQVERISLGIFVHVNRIHCLLDSLLNSLSV